MNDISSDVQNILKEMGVESVASLADGASDLSSIGDSIVSSLGWSPSAASCQYNFMKEIKELIFSSLQLSLLELNNALNESDLDSIKTFVLK